MRVRDIEPGRDYGRARAGYLPDRATVTSVTAQRVSYVDDRGKRGHARPNEIALHGAEAVRNLLHDIARDTWISGAWLAYHPDRAAVAEDDEYGISIQLTTQPALRLAALLQVQPNPAPRRNRKPGQAPRGGIR
ncbi:hypothetical protein [Micromonospora sp. NPDC005806]|uniref:hypothetical protein n=1 Tax=Micromonospora sp. NPDC005806 TaxID=3364234 RepID=UPI0036895CC8